MEVVIQLKEMSYNLSENIRGRIIRNLTRGGIRYEVYTSTTGFFWRIRYIQTITLYPDSEDKLLIVRGLYSEFGSYFSKYEIKGNSSMYSSNRPPYRFRMR